MLEKLRQLGFGEYEARAYVTLLRVGPATGYRVSREGGIPGAKVYEALQRLAERGAARLAAQADGEPARYVAVSPDEVLGGLRAKQERILDELGRELRSLGVPDDAPDSEWLRGRAPVLGRLSMLLLSAARTVALAIPSSLEPSVRNAIEKARERGARVDHVNVPERGAGGESAAFVAVIDNVTALIGTLGPADSDDGTQALATGSPFLIRFASDHVRLLRALAFAPNVVARLDRQEAWLDWEEAKQRRLLRSLGTTRQEPGQRPPN